MQNLYYEQPYQREFIGEIIDIREIDNQYHITLDNTYFYPGGGSIPCDTGSMDSTAVLRVYESEGIIYHVLGLKPSKIHRVKCRIDFEKRFDFMQQHLGQHIVSSLLLEQFNASTTKMKIGSDFTMIDIDKTIGHEEIMRVEAMANKIVFEGIEIETLYPSNAELKKLKIRNSSQKPGEKVKLIKIGDIETSCCPELHLKSTIEIQAIKFTDFEKIKTGTRLQFICGLRAVSDYRERYETIRKISKALTCRDSEIVNKVEGISGELNKALGEARSLKAELLEYEVKEIYNLAESINNIRIVKNIYDSLDLKYINSLASKLTSSPNVIVLFAVRSPDKVQLVFMRSKNLTSPSMNLLLKDSITLIDGSGGGSDFSAQGGGKNNNNLDSLMDYAYKRVKQDILSQ